MTIDDLIHALAEQLPAATDIDRSLQVRMRGPHLVFEQRHYDAQTGETRLRYTPVSGIRMENGKLILS